MATISKTPSSKTLAPGNLAPAAADSTPGPAVADFPERKVKVILRYHLRNLSTSGSPVDDATVFADALSDLNVGGLSSQVLFKALSRRDIVRNGGTDRTWPGNWLELTVATLAPQLAD